MKFAAVFFDRFAVTAYAHTVFRKVDGDGRACRDIGVVFDFNGSDDVRADKYAVADRTAVLVLSVVIDEYRAATDIALIADVDVAYVGKVRHFRAYADCGVFNFDKVSDTALAFDDASRMHVGKWTDGGFVPDTAVFKHAFHNSDFVADYCVFDNVARFDDAILTDNRVASYVLVAVNNGSRTDFYRVININVAYIAKFNAIVQMFFYNFQTDDIYCFFKLF